MNSRVNYSGFLDLHVSIKEQDRNGSNFTSSRIQSIDNKDSFQSDRTRLGHTAKVAGIKTAFKE